METASRDAYLDQASVSDGPVLQLTDAQSLCPAASAGGKEDVKMKPGAWLRKKSISAAGRRHTRPRLRTLR
ncbi:MAG: hypothetical protein WA459_03625 [Stellaceae bacterium]